MAVLGLPVPGHLAVQLPLFLALFLHHSLQLRKIFSHLGGVQCQTVIIQLIPRTTRRTGPWASWSSFWGTSRPCCRTNRGLLLFLHHHVVFRVSSISQSQETHQPIITSHTNKFTKETLLKSQIHSES